MALASGWQAAGALVLAERNGRAFRKPTVEAILSYSTGKQGRGCMYAVNTAMDETGATLGPLLIALALYLRMDVRTAYGLLLIPSVLALTALADPSVFGRCADGSTRWAPGLRALRSRLLKWRVGTGWHAFALLTAPLWSIAVTALPSLIPLEYVPSIWNADRKRTLVLLGVVLGLAAGLLRSLAGQASRSHGEAQSRYRFS